MKFELIKSGTFTVIENGKEVSITLTHDFEVMNIPVTEELWLELMGNVPDIYRDINDIIMVESRNGGHVQIRPQHPVTDINWWGAIMFANVYSKKHGYEAVYNTLNVNGRMGINSKGRFEPSDKKQLLNLKINAPDGDIYQAQGFRLPTEAEQLYLLTNKGTNKGPYWRDLNAQQMHQLACFEKKWGTIPVGTPSMMALVEPVSTRGPTIIDNAPIYGLYGNVAEYTSDWSGRPLTGGVDPSNSLPQSAEDTHVVARGGHVHSSADELKSTTRHRVDNFSYCNYERGLRLVRSLPK